VQADSISAVRNELRRSSKKGKPACRGASYQLFATVLVDVCYKVYGVVTECNPAPHRNNHLHALRELFERRLKQGRLYNTPCLGWSEFTPHYFGPLRSSTHVREDVDLIIPSMLFRVFDSDANGKYAPQFRQDLRIEKGVLRYAQ
jgi:CRISPR-associated protein Cas5d